MKRSLHLRRVLARGLIAIILLLAGFWIFENQRGAREWEDAQARAANAGVFLKRGDYAGAEIPDEENLLKNEVFMEVLEEASAGRLGTWWKLFADSSDQEGSPGGRRRMAARLRSGPGSHPGRGIICDYREYFGGDLSEEEALATLTRRTGHLNVRLDGLAGIILETPVHRVLAKEVVEGELLGSSEWAFPMQSLAGCLGDSARFAMKSGDSDRALVLIKTLDRLSRIAAAPARVEFLISGNIAMSEMNLIWEGLLLERWSGDELEELEQLLGGRDWGAGYLQVLGYQAATQLEVLNVYLEEEIRPQTYMDGRSHFLSTWLAIGGPKGWDDRRRAFVTHFYLDCVSSARSGLALDLDQFEKRFEGSTLSPLWSRF